MPEQQTADGAGKNDPHESMHAALRGDVRLLGSLLGDTIKQQHGEAVFDLVERVRHMAKFARQGNKAQSRQLIATLSSLKSEDLHLLARAFALFLNLANIAEQHHQLRQRRDAAVFDKTAPRDDAPLGFLDAEFAKLRAQGVAPDALFAQACALSIELVLTAHPTEIVRRSVAEKFLRITRLLAENDRDDRSAFERLQIHRGLHRAITEVWATDEIRRLRPTPVDEARTGLITLEQSLWHVAPILLREFDHALKRHTGRGLPLGASPIRFGSWMGGDRDGNPNTTPDVTRDVGVLNKLHAAELYLREIDALGADLSMSECNAALRAAVGDAHEPYRALLRQLQKKLRATIKFYARERDASHKPQTKRRKSPPIQSQADIRAPLMLCYQSLNDCGDGLIAEGKLTDVIRQLDVFGVCLYRLDIRQEAERHTAAIDAITKFLGLGGYAEWSEEKRLEFLVRELQNRRPLITSAFPEAGQADAEVREVLQTFRMLAGENPETLGAYVISMAASPSDVLAVELLQRECRVMTPMRVVPLFERLDALQGAAKCMDKLFSTAWYKRRINGRQEVMLGYSDSAKDAGKLAAAWGLYQAQEELTRVFAAHDVALTLFHGRGGSVARGGGPAYEAIRSQPPGSVQGRMRVTEQGEVIQAKFGLPGAAMDSIGIYIASVLETTLLPPPEPKPEWRRQAAQLATDAMDEFHSVVRDEPKFAEYFHLATPEQELGNLKIGSRPARRRKGGGIQFLRAIPWIFAWTQTRLMLPAWLGVARALHNACARGERDVLLEMRRDWPFFRATLDSIEMIFSKADVNVAALYDAKLVPPELQPLGESLREKYAQSVALLLDITQHRIPLEDEPVVRGSVDVRNTYVDPLNILQVELLARVRETKDDDARDAVLDALLVAINGIAAGMRNTG